MVNKELYTDLHPETTIKVYYKNKEVAKKSIKKIERKPLSYQLRVLVTLYYRAKYHPNRTNDMLEAMQIFKKQIKKIKNKQVKNKNKKILINKSN